MSCAYPLILLAWVTAFPAYAEPLNISAWRQAVAEKPPGDPARGRSLYEERSCAGCHGAKGIPDSTAWPVLAGQRPLYLYKLLLDYRDGRVAGGEAGTMSAVAASLELSDMADLAAWLSELGRPRPAGRIVEPAVVRGDRGRLLPPCEACHGAHGQGWDIQPGISGQNVSYLASTLTRFKRDERGNDINAGMTMIAKRLTEEEIKSLAEYYGR